MIKKRSGTNTHMDRWLFAISGALVAILLIVAVATIIFLSGQIFQSFAPIDNNDSEIRFNLEGYRNLNLLTEDKT